MDDMQEHRAVQYAALYVLVCSALSFFAFVPQDSSPIFF
jgi:hypothetical protein